MRETSGALNAFNIPLISVASSSSSSSSSSSAGDRPWEDDDSNSIDSSSEETESIVADILGKYDNLLTTVPDMGGQVRVRETV